MAGSGGTEAEVCLTSEVGPILKAFKRRWEADRPQASGPLALGQGARWRQTKRPWNTLGPWQWLAMESGVDQRRIVAIASQEYKTVQFSIVERILIALDRDYMFATGEVQILKNPAWSWEKYQAYMEERGCF